MTFINMAIKIFNHVIFSFDFFETFWINNKNNFLFAVNRNKIYTSIYRLYKLYTFYTLYIQIYKQILLLFKK